MRVASLEIEELEGADCEVCGEHRCDAEVPIFATKKVTLEVPILDSGLSKLIDLLCCEGCADAMMNDVGARITPAIAIEALCWDGEERGAGNYVQHDVHWKGEQWSLVLQRCDGKTPAADMERLRAECTRLREKFEVAWRYINKDVRWQIEEDSEFAALQSAEEEGSDARRKP